ncbi:MAG: bifunctional (p)ppGpp synthetase/guanosine-3',5'-bis(diphosphate) 3'-pyrophosphohydrolase [Desulfobacteraceae bacterium]|nr:bifunctional (p)ppGpp synthetase/guanosine-3',5'-bis(diphosphate) 3'-pyrophosphohydrolase [Desulfobacteraceae bacterium]
MNYWSQDKYIEAYRYAAGKHKNQKFPGTDWSYIVHLSMVSMEIIASLNHESDVDGDLAVQAAILHDILEDTDTNYSELRSQFGQKIADGVLALTKDQRLDKQKRMADSLHRIKAQPKEIWMVKLADRITNLQPPPEYWDMDKRQKYLTQADLILKELKGGSEYLANRLKDKIEIYKNFIIA